MEDLCFCFVIQTLVFQSGSFNFRLLLGTTPLKIPAKLMLQSGRFAPNPFAWDLYISPSWSQRFDSVTSVGSHYSVINRGGNRLNHFLFKSPPWVVIIDYTNCYWPLQHVSTDDLWVKFLEYVCVCVRIITVLTCVRVGLYEWMCDWMENPTTWCTALLIFWSHVLLFVIRMLSKASGIKLFTHTSKPSVIDPIHYHHQCLGHVKLHSNTNVLSPMSEHSEK